MPVARPGHAASFAGPAALIVCLASAAIAAGPAVVSPDETAGLSPTATLLLHVEPQIGRHARPTEGRHALTTGRAEDWHALTTGRVWQASSGDAFSGVPPVVRAQSPGIELLPLATGDPPIETTSLLRWVTGTKGRIRGDYLTDFDEVDRVGVHALTQTWMGLGIDAEANYWQRPVADLGREPLWTGDLNLVYNMFPHPRFKFRSGAGAAWTIDDGEPHAGYNVTHGLDVYLLWRFMATGEADWGQIDDDRLFRYRLALGLTFKFAEFYTGYESWRLGNERLDGWVNGVAVWY